MLSYQFKKILIPIRTYFKHRKSIRLLNKYLFLLQLNIHTIERVWKKNRKDLFLDSYLIITNKMCIDIESALLLTKKGYYGAAYTLSGGLYRTLRMLIALHAKPDLCEKYLDEDFDTYQVDKDFAKEFGETSLVKSINKKLGKDISKKDEIEKILHGSGYTARKYYCNRMVNEEGLRFPLLRFDSFYEYDKADSIINLLQGYVLDNIGLFLQEFQSRPEYKEFNNIRAFYFMYIDKAGLDK